MRRSLCPVYCQRTISDLSSQSRVQFERGLIGVCDAVACKSRTMTSTVLYIICYDMLARENIQIVRSESETASADRIQAGSRPRNPDYIDVLENSRWRGIASHLLRRLTYYPNLCRKP